jgi:hypothetical protein
MRHSNHSKWLRKMLLLTGIFGLGLAIFLSLRTSPATSTVSWLPKFITHWADRHGQLCNFPAYGLLALPFLFIAPDMRRQAQIVLGIFDLVALIEVIQFWIPTRVCDTGDVFWGWLGASVAWGIFGIFIALQKLFKMTFSPKPILLPCKTFSH